MRHPAARRQAGRWSPKGFKSAADICLDPTGKFILVPDMKAGTLTAVPAQVPGAEVDETPLPLEDRVAFPDLKWTGWSPETTTASRTRCGRSC